MRAVVIDRFGDVGELRLRDVDLPEVGPDEVAIEVEAAGVGEWDPFEREGGFAELLGREARFPYILGSEGAGRVTSVGSRVHDFEPGDRVYATGFLNAKGGFYAEYAIVDAARVSQIPAGLSVEQAAVVGSVGVTALRGLSDVLNVHAYEWLVILGASGAVGHLAVQLAKRMKAQVIAVASGSDGVELALALGADVAIDGRSDDVSRSIAEVAPKGVDAALLLTGGDPAERVVSAVRPGGRVAYPNGVEPVPRARSGVRISAYDAMPDRDLLDRLNAYLENGSIDVRVAGTFPIERVAEAHRAVEAHHLGKIALRIREAGTPPD